MRALILALMLVATPAAALVFEAPQPLSGQGFEGPASVLARAEKVVPLVRRTRDITLPDREGPSPSDLRVSMVVLQNGTGTDVSPTHDIHIALFNVIPEYGVAWALEPVAAVFKVGNITRKDAGIYEIEAMTYNSEQDDCYFAWTRITVDARQLSVAVRNAKGLTEFDARRYSVPIGTSITKIRCAEF